MESDAMTKKDIIECIAYAFIFVAIILILIAMFFSKMPNALFNGCGC
jgi:uncharacterized membrane protein YvbJ